MTAVPLTTKKDWSSDQEVRWCPGCGDYSILTAMQLLMPEIERRREDTVFVSGIGCAARFPYYMNTYGMHSIHGRSPAIATGLAMARPDLDVWVVGGDGDMLSIGGNHLIHALRRNVNLTVLLFNNQIYGLTKGQYSATVEKGSKKRKGSPNEQPPIDMCKLAINLGCGFVARSFSGAKKQLTALMKAALSHNGMAVIDVISPCVTFANNDESYKSYGYVKDQTEELHGVDYIHHFQPLNEVDIPEGSFEDVELFDGSVLRLETLSSEYDHNDPTAAIGALHRAEMDKKHITGLLHHNTDMPTADEDQGLVDTPLCNLSEDMLRPSRAKHEELMARFRA